MQTLILINRSRQFSILLPLCMVSIISTLIHLYVADYGQAVTRGKFGTHIWDLTVADISGNDFLVVSSVLVHDLKCETLTSF